MRLIFVKVMPLSVGLVHYKYGLGTGKTTSIIGLLIRAVGQGLRVALIQFLKHTVDTTGNGFTSGEANFFKAMKTPPNPIHIRQFGRAGFIQPKEGPLPEDFQIAKEGMKYAKELIHSKKFDVVALDEIMDTVYFGLVPINEIEELIKTKPKAIELVLSGHHDYPEIRELADYVTEFKPIKHPYEKGISARKGIEF